MRGFSYAIFAAAATVGATRAALAQEDYNVLKAFMHGEGAPGTALVKANDGNLYGATLTGATGATFRITPDGSYVAINDLRFLFGPIQGSDGYLYGNTQDTIYRIALTGEFTVVAAFHDSCLEGLIAGPLVEGDDGNFYAIAGTVCAFVVPPRILRVTPAGVITTIHEFAEYDGPSGLMKGRDGNFYGSTAGGGTGHGTLFRLTADGTFTTLHTFTGGPGGSLPRAPLVEARDGAFYGTTLVGGIGHGTIFRSSPDGGFTVLHAFSGIEFDGSRPFTQLIEGSDGNLYGTTEYTIFSMTPSGHVRVLHRGDNYHENGRWGWLFSKLVEWDDGNFYGTANSGGRYNNGLVFRLNRRRSTCVNELGLIFQEGSPNGVLYLTQVLKTERPALTGAWFVSQHSIDKLWFGPVPPISPTDVFELLQDPFPAIGRVGVFSFVLTSNFRLCADWTTVDTGGPGPTEEELRRKLISQEPTGLAAQRP